MITIRRVSFARSPREVQSDSEPHSHAGEQESVGRENHHALYPCGTSSSHARSFSELQGGLDV